jgi:hypothetical protein
MLQFFVVTFVRYSYSPIALIVYFSIQPSFVFKPIFVLLIFDVVAASIGYPDYSQLLLHLPLCHFKLFCVVVLYGYVCFL